MNKVYTENINIDLKNIKNVEKLFLIGKNKTKKTRENYVYMSIPFFRGVEFSITYKKQ